MYVHEVAKEGGGLKIRKGDSFVIPDDFLRLSLNPLRTRAKFFRPGMQFVAESLFLENLPQKRDELPSEIERLLERCDRELKHSPHLEGLDLTSEEDAAVIVRILKEKNQTGECWAYLTGVYLNIAKIAIEEADALQAAWAMACAERCRSMLVFKKELEEVVWMGQGAGRLASLLQIWDRQPGEQ